MSFLVTFACPGDDPWEGVVAYASREHAADPEAEAVICPVCKKPADVKEMAE